MSVHPRISLTLRHHTRTTRKQDQRFNGKGKDSNQSSEDKQKSHLPTVYKENKEQELPNQPATTLLGGSKLPFLFPVSWFRLGMPSTHKTLSRKTSAQEALSVDFPEKETEKITVTETRQCNCLRTGQERQRPP